MEHAPIYRSTARRGASPVRTPWRRTASAASAAVALTISGIALGYQGFATTTVGSLATGSGNSRSSELDTSSAARKLAAPVPSIAVNTTDGGHPDVISALSSALIAQFRAIPAPILALPGGPLAEPAMSPLPQPTAESFGLPAISIDTGSGSSEVSVEMGVPSSSEDLVAGPDARAAAAPVVVHAAVAAPPIALAADVRTIAQAAPPDVAAEPQADEQASAAMDASPEPDAAAPAAAPAPAVHAAAAAPAHPAATPAPVRRATAVPVTVPDTSADAKLAPFVVREDEKPQAESKEVAAQRTVVLVTVRPEPIAQVEAPPRRPEPAAAPAPASRPNADADNSKAEAAAAAAAAEKAKAKAQASKDKGKSHGD